MVLAAVLLLMVGKVWLAWRRQHAGKVIPPSATSEEEAGLEEGYVS